MKKGQATCIKGRENHSVHSHWDDSTQIPSDLTAERRKGNSPYKYWGSEGSSFFAGDVIL